jgi:hypothetical protein
VLAADTISADVKASLNAQFAQLDPVALLRHIDRLQDELWSYAYRERVTRVSLDEKPILAPVKREGICQQPAGGSWTFSSPPNRQVSCKQVAPDCDAAQTEADRPQRLYRKQKNKYKGERWWRTRPDDFAKIWPEVVQQLEQTPDLQARAFFLILQRRYPGQFKDGQLRTFHRRVRQWRREAAAQKLSAEDDY